MIHSKISIEYTICLMHAEASKIIELKTPKASDYVT